jgi:hypothetical protein
MSILDMGFEYQMEAVGLVVGIIVFIEGISWCMKEELPWYREQIRWYRHPRRRHLMTSYPDKVAA